MEYRPLGRTGMSVSHLTLGAMMFGAMGNPDREDCVRIVHRALEAGVTSINTADGYSGGQSEEILGEALTGGRRADVVLSVKTGRKIEGVPNSGGGSRLSFTHAIEGSLHRLRTDYIDVYELGVPDPDTDIDETLGALTDLVAAGKIRSFGTSKMPPSQLEQARAVSERRGTGSSAPRRRRTRSSTASWSTTYSRRASASASACSPSGRSPAVGFPVATAPARRS